MKIAMHQPNFIPWGGYFSRIQSADVFVIVDDVQYSHYSLTNRNRIKTPNGLLNLTVPLKSITKSDNLISNIKIDYQKNWPKKHLKTFEYCYKKAPYFNDIFGIIHSIYDLHHEKLVDFNFAFINKICKYLYLENNFLFSSSLGIADKSTDRLISICKHLNAKQFLHGAGGYKYFEIEKFRESEIDLVMVAFPNRAYPQLWGAFEPSLSIIDMLFNVGREAVEYL